MALGVFLVPWIVAQVRWIGLVHRLQRAYFVLGAVELVLGLSLHRRLPAKR